MLKKLFQLFYTLFDKMLDFSVLFVYNLAQNILKEYSNTPDGGRREGIK